MKVILSPKAQKHLKKLSKIDQIAVARKIRSIRDQKDILNKEKLKGYKKIYRVRVGRFRIVYKKTRQQIYIILIRHRKEIYKLLKKLLG